jgi:hypothetical protein
MAMNAKKAEAVGRRTCFIVMLAQTGSPSRARSIRVGIVYTAMTPHTGNSVNAVLSDVGTADVYRITGCSSAVVAVLTGRAFNIRIVQVGFVEMGSPNKALSHRRVAVAFAEAGVALGAPSLVVRSG